MQSLATRQRLLLAFADLASYGIEARAAMIGEPDQIRAQLAAELRAAYPRGLGAYVFYLARDEARFMPSGNLVPGVGLCLYCHPSSDVIASVGAACAKVGIQTDDAIAAGELIARDGYRRARGG